MSRQTPEGRVKDVVDKLLRKHHVYFEKPVTGGYGRNTLDYIGCSKGRYFAIETKPPGKEPTQLQAYVAGQMRDAGGVTFVVIGDQGLQELEEWLSR